MNKLSDIRDAVLDLPFHKACELALDHFESGRARLAFAVNDFTGNPQGVLHGGILYALMDVACFFALCTQLQREQHAVSVEVNTSVLRAAKKDETVWLESQVDRVGRNLAAMRCEAYAEDAQGTRRLIATGSVTKAILAQPG